MHILQKTQIEELLALEKLVDAQLPLYKAAPTKELISCLRSWSHIACNISLEAEPYILDQQSITDGLELIQHPVFICGVHRSGTTLMRDLLDDHPQLSVLPSEGSFFTQLNSHINHLPKQEHKNFIVEEWLRRLVNPINQPPYWLLGKSSKEYSPYVQFGRIFNAWTTILDARKPHDQTNLHVAIVLAYATIKNNNGLKEINYWVDKTPVIERYYNEIRTSFPQAKFIHIVRDPVNIYMSRKAMEPTFNIYRFISDIKLSFKTAMKHAHSSSDHYTVIKYEDLLDNTKDCISRIVSFLGIEETTSIYRPTVAGLPGHSNSSFGRQGMPGTIIKKNRNYQHSLTTKELELLSAHISRPAGFFGYKLNPVNYLKKLSLKAKHAIHTIG